MLGLLIAGATVLGLGSNLNAASKNDEAKRTNDSAREIIDDAKQMAKEAQNKCDSAMQTLARNKAMILNGSMKRFIKAYSKIGKVNFSGSDEELDLIIFNDAELSNIYSLCTSIEKSGINAAVSGASGTMLAVGAADFVAGGAILGEVSVAGTAMAGSALLGAVAAPVFAVSGLMANSEASANLERANANLDKALAYEEKCNTYRIVSHGIAERCDLFSDMLSNINSKWFEHAVNEVERIVNSKKGLGYAWQKITKQKIYTREEMATVSSATALAKTIKTIIDTNIIDSSGGLTTESEIVLDAIQGKISDGKKPVKLDELAEIQKNQKIRIEKIQRNRPKTNMAANFFRRISDSISGSDIIGRLVSFMIFIIEIAIFIAIVWGVFWVGKKVIHFVGDVFTDISEESDKEMEEVLQSTEVGEVPLDVEDVDLDLELSEEYYNIKYSDYKRTIRGIKGIKKEDVEDVLSQYFYYEFGDDYVINSRFFGWKKNGQTVYQYKIHQVYMNDDACIATIELEKNVLFVIESIPNEAGAYMGGMYSYEDSYDVYNENHTYDKEQMLPKSSYSKIAKSKIAKLSKKQLRIARNEIYARHGRRFKDKKLQKYFNKKNWYYGYISPDEFDEDSLNDIEKRNIKLLLKYENK